MICIHLHGVLLKNCGNSNSPTCIMRRDHQVFVLRNVVWSLAQGSLKVVTTSHGRSGDVQLFAVDFKSQTLEIGGQKWKLAFVLFRGDSFRRRSRAWKEEAGLWTGCRSYRPTGPFYCVCCVVSVDCVFISDQVYRGHHCPLCNGDCSGHIALETTWTLLRGTFEIQIHHV